MLHEINTEEFPDTQVKQRMEILANRFPGERETLKTAYKAVKEVEHRTFLAVSFAEPDLLTNEEARAYLKRAITDKKKLTESDKEALARLENEKIHIDYDLAKFDCDTTEKDYAKLEKLLNFAQSEMKFS